MDYHCLPFVCINVAALKMPHPKNKKTKLIKKNNNKITSE
jgi:hypothetical protein